MLGSYGPRAAVIDIAINVEFAVAHDHVLRGLHAEKENAASRMRYTLAVAVDIVPYIPSTRITLSRLRRAGAVTCLPL